MVPREIIENNAYVKFWMENKEYYGIFKVAYKVEGTIVDKWRKNDTLHVY